MEKLLKIWIVYILLTVSLVAADVNISGYVNNAVTEIVINGAIVKLYNTTNGVALLDTNQTASDGFYHVGGVCVSSAINPQNYTVSYDASSYESLNYSFILRDTRRNPACPYIKVDFNQSLVPLAIPKGEVSGTVRVNKSPFDPIFNDSIVFVMLSNTLVDILTTDSNGFYAVNLSPNNYTFNFIKTDFVSQTENVSVTNAASITLNADLNPKSYLEGRVLSGGSGVSGVRIIVGDSVAITDNVGLYSISTYPGFYNVTISHSGYVAATFNVNLSSGTVTYNNFSISPIPVTPSAAGGGRGTPFIDLNETYEENISEPFVPPEPGAATLELKLYVETPTRIIKVTTHSFDIPVEIENTGNAGLRNILVQLETPSGWKTKAITVPSLQIKERKIVRLSVESILCSDKFTKETNYIEDTYQFKAKVSVQNVRLEHRINVKLDIPAITPFVCPPKINNNVVESLILINNKGKPMQEKVEVEYDVSDGKSHLLLDYYKVPVVEADKVMVLRKVYDILDVPETKEYNINVKMYKGGNLFADDYLTEKGESKIYLNENVANDLVGQAIRRFSWLRGE